MPNRAKGRRDTGFRDCSLGQIQKRAFWGGKRIVDIGWTPRRIKRLPDAKENGVLAGSEDLGYRPNLGS